MKSNSEPPRARIDRLASHEGQRVRLQGWLYNRRSSSKLHFLQIRDGSGIVQCVVSRADVTEELFESAGTLGQESSIELCGTVQADPRAPGGFEVLIDELVLPRRVKKAEPMQIRTNVVANSDGEAMLRLMCDNQVIAERGVSLRKGDNVFLFSHVLRDPGFHHFEAEVC